VKYLYESRSVVCNNGIFEGLPVETVLSDRNLQMFPWNF